ncbi:glycerophosphodiester phosphodiesterase family protein [Pontibacter mucosus]|nr:glycerophosphodiester phosphodiesterase family protein [Pontibacter mucosus]
MLSKLQPKLYFMLALFLLWGCSGSPVVETEQTSMPEFFKVGHRGTRGYMPENTIPSMKKAIDDGANVLEVDIQISIDKQVVVAHDPHINAQISLTPEGKELTPEQARQLLLYQMPYAEIRKYDVGSRYHDGFPEQQKMATYMPLLGELIDSVEQYTASKGLPPVIYNIEIKANPDQDGVYQPKPEEYVALVMDEVRKRNLGGRFYIQSFDRRQIQQVHQQYPEVTTALLVGDANMSFEEHLEKLGYKPPIYSPHFSLVTPGLVAKCREQSIKLVPWTVNTLEDMSKLKAMGVDGIITDYPNLLTQLD